eukprot:CAMPEP_0183755504 /NCGR_PEP_ID=MMETSP0739-20130205/4293_1 /TAXON_ID=385413 /ORGANISM="Thalassiosira miniscula, Strain CCMP1093" /LENGTH=83 /DNA_ID=CAMNT_0025992397 /DNA_START=76 /DNA_END=325 /DNA_ORIENTATION=+
MSEGDNSGDGAATVEGRGGGCSTRPERGTPEGGRSGGARDGVAVNTIAEAERRREGARSRRATTTQAERKGRGGGQHNRGGWS